MPSYSSYDELCPVFIKCPEVSKETLIRLNNAHLTNFIHKYFDNFFNPVPKDLTKLAKPGEDYIVEVTDATLRQVEAQIEKGGYSMAGAHAVLDSNDDTILLYYTWTTYYDEKTEEEIEDEQDYCDRVRFSDALAIVELFNEHVSPDQFEQMVLWQRKEFTINGIFEYGLSQKAAEEERKQSALAFDSRTASQAPQQQ